MPFELSILTPQGVAYSGTADSVVLPGSEGDFGVLPSHERFLTPLRVGAVKISAGAETVHAAVSTGFADVSGEAVAVLVDSCELSSEIDATRAQEALSRAESGLSGIAAGSDEARAQDFEAALQRAKNRLEVSQLG